MKRRRTWSVPPERLAKFSGHRSKRHYKFHAARFAGYFTYPDQPEPWTRGLLWSTVQPHEVERVHAMHSRILVSLLQTGRAIARCRR